MAALYLLVNALSIAIPFAASFENRIGYYRKWRVLIPALAITAGFFIVWDIIFTRLGVWGFNSYYLTGVYLFFLPLEEWLFFFTIPYASVFIYESIKTLIPPVPQLAAFRILTLLLSAFLMVLAVCHRSLAYTFWNFLFAGIFLLFIGIRNPSWLGTFYLAYLIHLIPFFVVNSILTGSWIDEEVVWYNNAENLAFRIGTIPIEDTIYALLLLLMNVTLFEHFKKQKLTSTTSLAAT